MLFVVKLWLYNYTFTIGVYKFEVTNLNQPERFQRKWLSQLNRFFCSSCLYDTVSLEISKKTPVLLCAEAWFVHVCVAAQTNGALVHQKGRSWHVYKSARSAISSEIHSTEATVIDS